MSNAAIDWAEKQPTGSSGARQLLVTLANVASDRPSVSRFGKEWPALHAYLSIASMCERTLQDRKTVIANIKRLKEAGFIRAVGTDGATNQTIVFVLCMEAVPEAGPVPTLAPVPALVQVPTSGPVPETGPGQVPQLELAPEAGPVPNFPSTSTVFPGDQYRFSLPPVPKTGHETQENPIEPKEETKSGLATQLPACPHKLLIELWKQKAPVNPAPIASLWKGKSADAMRARWDWLMTETDDAGVRLASTEAEAIAWFADFFTRVGKSSFLTGHNDRKFQASLQWVLKAENFTKTLQGNYDNRGAAKARSTHTGFADIDYTEGMNADGSIPA